jgi:hypothetical protein
VTGRITESPKIANLFQFDLMKIAIIADPSHLLKLIRNMLQNKGIVKIHPEYQQFFNLVTNEISWQVIEDVVKFQETHELRINPKLNAATLKRGKSQFGKMDVGCAIAVFSKDTTSAIQYMVLHHDYPETYLATAQFVYEVAHWWEIMSCQHFSMAFSMARPEMHKEQCAFVERFSDFFSSIQIDELKSGQPHAYTEVQQGVLITSWSILWLQKDLLTRKNLKFFMAGRTSGDNIENHHSNSKAMTKNPSPLQIERISKALAVCQVLGNVKGSNCPDDQSTEALGEFKNLKKLELAKAKEEQDEADEDFEFLNSNGHHFNLDTDHGFAEANALSNWLGCALKRTILSKKHKGCYCEKCSSLLVEKKNEESLQMVNELIDNKKIGEIFQRNFTRPSILCNNIFHEAEALFKANRNLYFKKQKLDEKILSFIEIELKKIFNLKEICHLKQILRKFIFGRLHFWAAHINRNGKQINEPAREEASNASRTARQLFLVE